MKALPDANKSFAHTQALWRFLKNARVTPTELNAPLLAMAHAEVKTIASTGRGVSMTGRGSITTGIRAKKITIR